MKFLENNFLTRKENYPRYMSTVQKQLVNYKPMENFSGATSYGIMFANNENQRTRKVI